MNLELSYHLGMLGAIQSIITIFFNLKQILSHLYVETNFVSTNLRGINSCKVEVLELE